jgi:nitrate reductase NapE component
VVGGLIGQWLQMGFWPVLAGALIGGFIPIVAYRVWKRSHHRREP